jgi:hypothetical protein
MILSFSHTKERICYHVLVPKRMYDQLNRVVLIWYGRQVFIDGLSDLSLVDPQHQWLLVKHHEIERRKDSMHARSKERLDGFGSVCGVIQK